MADAVVPPGDVMSAPPPPAPVQSAPTPNARLVLGRRGARVRFAMGRGGAVAELGDVLARLDGVEAGAKERVHHEALRDVAREPHVHARVDHGLHGQEHVRRALPRGVERRQQGGRVAGKKRSVLQRTEPEMASPEGRGVSD